MRHMRRVVVGTSQVDGAGVKLVRVLGRTEVADFDPFLMLDAFDSNDPADYIKGFPWHPHRGIETVTYLIRGAIEHGDSLGNRGVIRDGGCQWMTAGSGIIHREMPQASERMLGLQLWVNLPRKDKWAPPQYRDLTADRIPAAKESAGLVRVISGRYGAVTGSTQGDYVPVRILDIELHPDATWRLPVDAGATLFIYIIDGGGRFGPEFQRSVERRRAVLFADGHEFSARAGAGGMRFVLFEGRPLREPVAWGGPIVMNTREELDQAFEELDRGTFLRHVPPGA